MISPGGADGVNPGSLIKDSTGLLYGTTNGGGTSEGTIFQITTGGSLKTLYTFSGEAGYHPASLIIGTDGNFYGVAAGGTNGAGEVFQVTPAGGFTVLHTFSATDEDGLNTDGADPQQVIQGKDGNLYGVAQDGGRDDSGTVFEVATTGRFSLLYDFGKGIDYNDAAGQPQGLVQGSDGNFYVTTPSSNPGSATSATSSKSHRRALSLCCTPLLASLMVQPRQLL